MLQAFPKIIRSKSSPEALLRNIGWNMSWNMNPMQAKFGSNTKGQRHQSATRAGTTHIPSGSLFGCLDRVCTVWRGPEYARPGSV